MKKKRLTFVLATILSVAGALTHRTWPRRSLLAGLSLGPAAGGLAGLVTALVDVL